MKFAKHNILISISLVIYVSCFAQREKIDSLINLLSSLHDTIRIDCMNDLCKEYIFKGRKDSAKYYASLAYEESTKLNYIHGIAKAFSNKSQIAKHFDDDFVQSEQYARQSLYWFQNTGNNKGIDELYFYLLYNFVAQSKFDEGIYYGKQYYKWAKQHGDQSILLDATGWLINLYRSMGDYETSFLFAQQLHDLAIKAKDKIWISTSYYSLAQLYQLIGDYQEALNYFRKVIRMDDSDIEKERIRTDNDIWFKMEFTESFSHLNQFDSAWHYYNLYNPGEESIYYRIYLISTGECYLLQKKYQEALKNLLNGLNLHKKVNDRNEIMRAQLDVAKAYLAQSNNVAALRFAREGLAIALPTKTRHVIRDGYRILYTAFDNLHKNDSAYFYYRQYSSLKDSILSDQFKGKLVGYNYVQRIALLNKEKEVQQAQLKTEFFQKRILIGSVVCLILVSGIILRNVRLKRKSEVHRRELAENELQIQKLESEKTKVELHQQATNLEMQALRAQMNPHFIFNALNAINHFILKNESEIAANYLIKFSRLIRMILNNSSKSFIPLEDELETLQLYIDLERLRFKNSFDYKSNYSNKIDACNICIPPLILQPFVENAIWHGLMHKEAKGKLDINITLEDGLLCCTITDDGIGRANAGIIKDSSSEKTKSMGLNITKNRINLINEKIDEQEYFIIHDLVDDIGKPGGTKVIIKIKYRQLSEVYN